MAILPEPKTRYDRYFNYPQTIVRVAHPVTGEFVTLDIPAQCWDAEDIEWVTRTWQDVFRLDWNIAHGKSS